MQNVSDCPADWVEDVTEGRDLILELDAVLDKLVRGNDDAARRAFELDAAVPGFLLGHLAKEHALLLARGFRGLGRAIEAFAERYRPNGAPPTRGPAATVTEPASSPTP